MNNLKSKRCPFCDSEYNDGFAIISGGVWWSRSSAILEKHISGNSVNSTEDHSTVLHCLVSSRGYRGSEKWPRHSYYCSNCHAFSIGPRREKVAGSAGIKPDVTEPED